MTTHADFHFLSSTISAKFIVTLLFGPNVFMIFRTLISYRENEVGCQKRYLEISCEYVEELSFALIY